MKRRPIDRIFLSTFGAETLFNSFSTVQTVLFLTKLVMGHGRIIEPKNKELAEKNLEGIEFLRGLNILFQ